MISYNKNNSERFDSIPVDVFWNTANESEHKIHRIHAYPAKFPAFLTTKAIEHAREKGLEPKKIADVFCGCGTVSYEARRNSIDFWGCDLNPVATLIAQVKSKKFQEKRLRAYYKKILASFNRSKIKNQYPIANERLKYWYKKKQYNELSLLKSCIERNIPESSDYRLFFYCAFSNILKSTSVWLTKSIKPQVDPDKKPTQVLPAFKEQVEFMIEANNDSVSGELNHSKVVTDNVLSDDISPPKVDLIVTSPPYVTSYEYADLHQLSSLWLGYTDDYRELRNGSIGTASFNFSYKKQIKKLNKVGSSTVFKLLNIKHRRTSSVTKYFIDMQLVAYRCHEMLRKNGIALFVVGNTEFKGVRIDNAQHLAESLKDAGFKKIKVTKRKISNKILTPYRNDKGRFTTDSSGRKVYNEEFIIIGYK